MSLDLEFTADFLKRHQDKLLFGSDCRCSDGHGAGYNNPAAPRMAGKCVARETLSLVVIALAVSCSFTSGLFFATAVFPMGPVLIEAKVGALSTIAGALLATSAAWLFGIGRFERRARARTQTRAHG